MANNPHGRAKCGLDNLDALLLPYQRDWVLDRSRIKLVEKSRQIGFSWATAYDLIRQSSLDTTRLDTWVSSRDEMQARLFLEDCKKFADILDIAGRAVGENILRDDGGKPYTSFDLKFANGTTIHSMSSNADAQAGKRGTRVLDEFALHPDPIKLYAIAYPGITWGGQMAIISTHRGAQNFFNQLVEEAKYNGNPKKISLHRVTLEDALAQGFLAKLQAKLKDSNDPRQDMDETEYFDDVKSKCADEESFLQEYMCVPADDASVFISADVSEGCFYRFGEVWETDIANCAGDLYIGVDVGRDNDLTVIWILEKLGGMLFTRRVETLKGMKFSEQESVLYPYLSLPKMRRCCIDQTGLGRQFAERAQDKFGKYRVEGVQFTAPSKEKMAYPLRAKFEDKTIRIPDTREIRSDIRGVKKTVGASGAIRFDAARSENGHCDRFWALALAVEASGSSTQSYFKPIGRKSDRRLW